MAAPSDHPHSVRPMFPADVKEVRTSRKDFLTPILWSFAQAEGSPKWRTHWLNSDWGMPPKPVWGVISSLRENLKNVDQSKSRQCCFMRPAFQWLRWKETQICVLLGSWEC